MSDAAEGILAYGVALGGENDGWKIQGVGRWETWRPEWLKSDEQGDYADASYERDAMTVLLADAGFTETDKNADGYYERRGEALARVGVDFVAHGHAYGFKQLILATFSMDTHSSRVKVVGADLILSAPTEKWDKRLRHALTVLGIEPIQEDPMWLLTAWYG